LDLAPQEQPGLRVGNIVQHDKLGRGAVLAMGGHGDEAYAEVAFGEHGQKRLLLSKAKLTKVGE
jgi:DNA helicase-2/ATP-dependent DNA helicase PcrA